MFDFLSDFFEKKHLDLFAPINLEDCSVQKPYLLERAGISSGTAVMIAVPYFTKAAAVPERNISAYAVSRDYHGFFKELFGELIPVLQQRYPDETFAGFADHSPIKEGEAAARAGLGIIGKNHLLITEKYSSYIFLGELITSAKLKTELHPIKGCENCGRCQKACPIPQLGNCLSAITQKKGELTDAEQAAMLRYGTAWGCDICQEVCPHTVKALKSGSIFTPIPYFRENTTPVMTVELLDGMDDDAFAERAYSWRGRQTLRRNLLLFEQNKDRESKGKDD